MMAFRRSVSILLSAGLIQLQIPLAAQAAPAPEEMSPAMERLHEAYDKLRPVRQFETMSEMYYRLFPYMSAEEAKVMSDHLYDHGNLPMPEVKLEGKEIVSKFKGHEMRLGIEGEKLRSRFS